MAARSVTTPPHPVVFPITQEEAVTCPSLLFATPPTTELRLWSPQPQLHLQSPLVMPCPCFMLDPVIAQKSIVIWNVPNDAAPREVRNLFAFARDLTTFTPCVHFQGTYIVGFTQHRAAREASQQIDNYIFEFGQPEFGIPPVSVRARLVTKVVEYRPLSRSHAMPCDGEKNAPCDTLFVHHFPMAMDGVHVLNLFRRQFGDAVIDSKFVQDRRGHSIGFVQFDSIDTAIQAKTFATEGILIGCAFSVNPLHQRR